MHWVVTFKRTSNRVSLVITYDLCTPTPHQVCNIHHQTRNCWPFISHSWADKNNDVQPWYKSSLQVSWTQTLTSLHAMISTVAVEGLHHVFILCHCLYFIFFIFLIQRQQLSCIVYHFLSFDWIWHLIVATLSIGQLTLAYYEIDSIDSLVSNVLILGRTISQLKILCWDHHLANWCGGI